MFGPSTSFWYNTGVNGANSQAYGETDAGLRESWAKVFLTFKP